MKDIKWLRRPGYKPENWDLSFGEIRFYPQKLKQPLKWRSPRMVLINSGELFDIEYSEISEVLRVVAATKRHTYLVLTKREDRMMDYCGDRRLPENLWMGITCKNQKEVERRTHFLEAVNAAVRFISIEPVGGKANLSFCQPSFVFFAGRY